MTEGNYAGTAARLARLSTASVRGRVAQAEGVPSYALVAEIIQLGAEMAEAESLSHVRAAGRDPRHWATSMTFLERRYPGKWGRRTGESDAARVIVQFGVGDSELTIGGVKPDSDRSST